MLNQIELHKATAGILIPTLPRWLMDLAHAVLAAIRPCPVSVNESLKLHGQQSGITFVSEFGQGSTFTARFSHSDPPTNALANPAPQPLQINTAKVKKTLVIDDEADVRDVLEDFLTYYGVQVLQAASGMAGLEILRSDLTAVDLVILDLAMPGMNGVETLSHIRQLSTRLPVIISSGYSQQRIETQLAQDPQIRFLGKPYTYPQLCQTIESLMN